MNFKNFDRLVSYLNDLIVDAPEQFNYARYEWTDSGCLACHCRILAGHKRRTADQRHIREWLNCTQEEAMDLFARHPWGIFGPYVEAPERGVEGIREALRRLAILATRYERPTAQSTFVPDEAAFLNSLRDLTRDLPATGAHTTKEVAQ